ncbi:MAG: sigma-70 family RNA polymerase sigma factor [Phycisphaerales bacterium]|nr:MAG: sigma-70 family RNA polymerase sigma factor [Phycisphaerales bacterium]
METTRASLLVRVGQNDSAAWREFDALYRPMLHRFARSRGLGEADAEDVTQSCMAAISRHIHGFDYDPNKGRFKGWLRTLVNNYVRNLQRRRAAQLAESQDFKRPQQREKSPEDLFDRLWMETHLKHCLRLIRAEVDPVAFRAFKSHVLQERSVQQVCEEFELTPNQVYKIKWRIMRKLHEKMKELLGEIE